MPNTAPILPSEHLTAVYSDLTQLERKYTAYLEQEELRSDVQCLRSWIESCQNGDAEAADYLGEHGSALIENIKVKLQNAAREIQRIDEESPVGVNFTGGKSDRLNKAAKTALHAEDELAKALNDESKPAESKVVTK